MITSKRVATALSTITAGLLLNLGEFLLNRVVLHDEWRSVTHTEIRESTILLLTISLFGFSFALVRLHALLRQVILPARHSAIVAGLMCWFLSYGIGWSWCYLLGTANGTIYVVTIVWSLLEVSIAALAGAMVYDKCCPPTASVPR